jgi:hypothetical protein
MLGREGNYNTGMLPTENPRNSIFDTQNIITQLMLNHGEHKFITTGLHVNPFMAETTQVTTEVMKHVIPSILTYFTTCRK